MSIRRDNLKMVGKLAVVTAGMFAFGYALVPLYKAICEVTGINVLALTERDTPGAASRARNCPQPPSTSCAADRRSRTDTVRIGSDAELGTFVRNLLQLFENPKTRADLRAGRLTFRLAGTPRGSGAGPTAHRVERGAVTERHIAELGDSGATLILGPRAVLTPLARERARALGITISKERT